MNALKDIYFYNANALAIELKEGTLSEHRAVKHMIASFMLAGISIQAPVVGYRAVSSLDIFYGLSYIVFFVIFGFINFYGVWLTYQVNSKGDGNDYFLRFTVLSLPIGIQILILLLGACLAFVLISLVLLSALKVTAAFTVILHILGYLAVIILEVLYFTRMRKYIALAAGLKE